MYESKLLFAGQLIPLSGNVLVDVKITLTLINESYLTSHWPSSHLFSPPCSPTEIRPPSCRKCQKPNVITWVSIFHTLFIIRIFTVFENHSKCLILKFLTFWHFPPIFVLLKVTCLVALTKMDQFRDF